MRKVKGYGFSVKTCREQRRGDGKRSDGLGTNFYFGLPVVNSNMACQNK